MIVGMFKPHQLRHVALALGVVFKWYRKPACIYETAKSAMFSFGIYVVYCIAYTSASNKKKTRF